METGSDNRFNADWRIDPTTNRGELHQTTAMTEQGHGSTINSHLEAHPSTLGNNPAPPSSSSPSSSQNPFLILSDLDNNIGNGGMMNNDSSSTYLAGSLGDTHHSSTVGLFDPQSSFATSTHESSPGNQSQESPRTDNEATFGAFDSWKNQPFEYETVPTNVEPQNPLPVIEEGHQNMASNNMWTPFSSDPEPSSQVPIQVSVNANNKSQIDTHTPPKFEVDPQISEESSDDDIPISSMPNHAQSGDVAGAQHSTLASIAPTSNEEFGIINIGSEIHNPPLQVMERPGGGSDASATYVFPSHVFARNATNAPGEWSTASNESLFSIYMGNMSFSSELMCFGKAELDKPGGDMFTLDTPNASPSPQPPSAPVSKFNDISQITAELHEESAKVTEAKAAETMREVIMETSRTTENTAKGDDRNQSIAIQSSTDKDKSVASKGAEEKQKQQKPTEKQQETPNAVDQSPKPTTNAPPKGGCLSCFACCTFCQ